ncbi:MAG: hypothetical protein IPN70_03520 [Candidatus Moraniibacteriota bacterium]|nr:MAG: hypothetical protein IPN70_03520 [Candidatus Moranbacteria bacterium]
MTKDKEIRDAETDELTGSKTKAWFEENLRLIVSVFIVLAIAGGINSYSKRGQENKIAINEPTQEQILLEEDAFDEEEITESESLTEEPSTEKAETPKEEVSSAQTETSQEIVAVEEVKEQKEEVKIPEQPKQETPSQETSGGFLITAQRGDGLTHMARKATADYLTQNPDASLTAEHKIYIEDYVRKAVGHKGKVAVGTQVNFSKDLIRQAIEASKGLTDMQIKNLHKYSVLVSSP